MFTCNQADLPYLSHIATRVAPDGFDVIVDDASHEGHLTRDAFWHLFEHHLRPGGIYVIEDWGTGYWDTWPDGKTVVQGQPHTSGMVGFIKELVDEVGAADMVRGGYTGRTSPMSRFKSVTLYPGIAFVQKND